MSMLELLASEAEFERRAAGEAALLVTFTGPKCMICRRLAPMLETVLREAGPALGSAKIDAEALPALAERFEVRSLPTTLLFRNGALTDRLHGFATAGRLRDWLRQNAMAFSS